MGRRERPEERFRKWLRIERDRHGWSQAEVAKALSDNGVHVHATTIAKIEAGDRAPRIDEVAATADLFGVSVDSMLGRKTALQNDLAQAIQSLRSAANKAMWDINMTLNVVRERAADVADFDFEGRDALDSELLRASGAIEEAQAALYAVVEFELPPDTAARLRDELIAEATYEQLGKLLKAIDEKDRHDA